MNNLMPLSLLLAYAAVFIFSAIEPYSRPVWIAEIIPAVLVLALMLVVHRRFPLSNTSYVLVFIWMSLHTVGAHYTFANVPFDWFNNLIGSERNNFDRLAHFSIGLYAFPIAEWVSRKRYAVPWMAGAIGVLSVMAIAAGYEIIEWWYAELAGGDAGVEFLGSQGDIWDAQKDMLMDTLGGVVSIALFFLVKPYNKLKNS